MATRSTRKKGPSKRRPRLLIDEHEPDFGPKVQGRLYEDDDQYLRTKMVATGKSEGEIVRLLMRKGIRLDRLERASRDPNINTLLNVVDQALTGHTAKFERRLSTELHTLRRLTATAIVMANAAMRTLEAYVANQPPPDDKTILQRRDSYFDAFYQRTIMEAEGILDGMLDERETVLTLLTENDLITAVKDHDLDASLEAIKSPSKDDETSRDTES